MCPAHRPSSPDKLVFIVGCPRSGTTWLQLLLTQHPRVTTAVETHLFPEYISPMMRRWRGDVEAKRKIGLSKAMEETVFHELLRGFMLGVVDKSRSEWPEADVFVEKTPTHGLHAEEILKLFPDAIFIHIVRDPRAVAASLLVVSRTWAGDWAPSDPAGAAAMWRDVVTRTRSIADRTDRYAELRYEDLIRDTAGELAAVLRFIGVEDDPAILSQAIEACAPTRLKQADRAETRAPEAMYSFLPEIPPSAARVDAWRERLGAPHVGLLEWHLRDLMPEFGYEFEHGGGDRTALGVLRLRISQKLSVWARRTRRGER